MKSVIHKMLGHGIRSCICGTHGLVHYRWEKITCKHCLKLRNTDFTKAPTRRTSDDRRQSKVIQDFAVSMAGQDKRSYQERRMTSTEKMEKAIRRVLATAYKVEAGAWHVSSDNIAALQEALIPTSGGDSEAQ